jgi:hypothetical protein
VQKVKPHEFPYWRNGLPTPSPLPLLVPGVAADNEHFALAAHDLAVFANPAHAGANLHARYSESRLNLKCQSE